MKSDFRLSDDCDWEALRQDFAQHGRVEISNLLVDGQAEALREELIARDDWKLVLNAGDNVYEISRPDLARLDSARRRDLDRLVIDAARNGFQYRYEAIRIPDRGDAGSSDPLARFVAFLSSPEVIGRLNGLLGNGTATFADGQATSYGEGHFLTRHDDDVHGKRRQAAYVFSLVPRWRPEWGGLLMFHGADDDIDEVFAPRMGALRLFSVPQPHSVSFVTPFAPEPRLSITGWLRAD